MVTEFLFEEETKGGGGSSFKFFGGEGLNGFRGKLGRGLNQLGLNCKWAAQDAHWH